MSAESVNRLAAKTSFNPKPHRVTAHCDSV